MTTARARNAKGCLTFLLSASGSVFAAPGDTVLVSTHADGTAMPNSVAGVISGNGRFVAFYSTGADNVKRVYVKDLQSTSLEEVSISSDGVQANGDSQAVSISDDGRYVAFRSDATNLDLSDTNAVPDVFLRDLGSDTTTRIQNVDGVQNSNYSDYPVLSGDGRWLAYDYASEVHVYDTQTGQNELINGTANGLALSDNEAPAISYDGRYVSFATDAAIARDDTNHSADIYVHDRQTGANERISLDPNGRQIATASHFSKIGGNGRYVLFVTADANVWPGDSNDWYDLFLRDRQTNATEIVSLDYNNAPGAIEPRNIAINADGRYVGFSSDNPAYVEGVPGDTNGFQDAFVLDRISQHIIDRVSVDSSGSESNGTSGDLSLSAGGALSAFTSDATNLVDASANGGVFLHESAIFPPSNLVLAPYALGFDPQTTNTASAAQTVQIRNFSNNAVMLTSVKAAGANASEFPVSHNCPATLAAQAICAVNVTFKPTGPGARSASLSVNGGGSGLRVVSLQGTGSNTPFSFELAPSSLSFGIQEPNTVSLPQTVLVRNTGTSSLSITAITLAGAPQQFLKSTACGSMLASGATCAIDVKFRPTSAGVKNGTLSVKTPQANTQTVAISGSGVPVTLSSTPNPVDFGNVPRNTPVTRTVTIKNTGTVGVEITLLTIPNTSVFQISQRTCGTRDFTLEANASCSLTITMRTPSKGIRTGYVRIDPAHGSQIRIPLMGKGM